MTNLERSEAAYANACEQIDKWRGRSGDFALQQVELWTEIRDANSWCLPGAAHAGEKVKP